MSLLTLDQFLAQSPLPSFQRRPPPSPPLDDDEASSAAAAVEGVPLPEEPPEGMYLTEKPSVGVGFYGEGPGLPPPQLQQQQQMMMVLAESSSEDHEVKAPKKRAETWVQEETRSLIGLRRELDGLFNTSKSNKHLWEQISNRMREKGFDRSPTMCTDKWRNLLKEFKKAKHQQARGSGSAKMSYYKELDELLKARNKSPGFKNASGGSTAAPPSKVDTYLQFSDKGLDDANTPFGSAEGPGSCRSALNMDRPLDHDRHPLAITAAEAVAANSVPPWNWRDASANENNGSYGGRVILVKCGEYSRKIGIDGTAEAIKEAIKSAFGLRTKRAFWLEDEDDVVRSLDRDMPLGTYTLHLDEGIKIRVCIYDDADRIPGRSEEKTFYTEDDFRDFLMHRGWAGLRDLTSFRNVDTLNDLHPGAMYQGVRLLGD